MATTRCAVLLITDSLDVDATTVCGLLLTMSGVGRG
jgi:hypothetical protein